MAGLSLTQAQSKLDALNTAYDALIGGVESYSISTATGSRSLSRRNLTELREEIEYWDRRVQRLSRGGLLVRGASPSG